MQWGQIKKKEKHPTFLVLLLLLTSAPQSAQTPPALAWPAAALKRGRRWRRAERAPRLFGRSRRCDTPTGSPPAAHRWRFKHRQGNVGSELSQTKLYCHFQLHAGDELTRELCSWLWKAAAHPCRDRGQSEEGQTLSTWWAGGEKLFCQYSTRLRSHCRKTKVCHNWPFACIRLISDKSQNLQILHIGHFN